MLIGSSLTMALAVRAAQTNNRKATVNWLILTMILGCVFLGVKVIEYQDKFEQLRSAWRQLQLGCITSSMRRAAGEHGAAAAPAAADHRS